MIDKVFAEAKTQAEYWSGMYRLAFSDWDEIEEIEGYPTVSEKTGEYIMGKAIEWDDAHPEMRGKGGLKVMSGGLWMNKGFSSRKGLLDYVIYTGGVKIEYKYCIWRCDECETPCALTWIPDIPDNSPIICPFGGDMEAKWVFIEQ